MNNILLARKRICSAIAAASLLGLALAGCDGGDLPGAGERLPEGKYPLSLTATVGSPQTRAGGMDRWQGGEAIAVSVGDYTGKYTMGATGNATASDVPYYWKNTATATVRAWYPYAEGDNTYDISDQSQGYAAFDLLYAETEGSYAAPVHLAFSHQMAKVSYTLVKGSSITDTELAAAKVTLLGDRSVAVSGGKITAAPTSQTDEITPCHDAASLSGSAVMVPQNMTGKPLIKVSVSGNDFIYTPNTEAAGNLQAGNQNKYNITLKTNGIEVVEATGGEWTDGGSEKVGITITYDGTETEAKIGDYYYADGTWSDGGLRKLYADGRMEWETTTPQSDKTVIGIVFYTGRHETDRSDYTKPLTDDGPTIPNGKVNGYVVALTDATSDYCMWGVYGTELGCYPTDAGGNKQNNYSNPDIDWSGYAWTQKIITAAGGKGKLNATEQAGYPATWYAAVSYETGCNAPSNSSGWFLPSIGQMRKISLNRSSLFGSVSGADDLKPDWYWSSSEYYSQSAARALYVNVGNSSVGDDRKGYSNSYVRPVLAF